MCNSSVEDSWRRCHTHWLCEGVGTQLRCLHSTVEFSKFVARRQMTGELSSWPSLCDRIGYDHKHILLYVVPVSRFFWMPQSTSSESTKATHKRWVRCEMTVQVPPQSYFFVKIRYDLKMPFSLGQYATKGFLKCCWHNRTTRTWVSLILMGICQARRYNSQKSGSPNHEPSEPCSAMHRWRGCSNYDLGPLLMCYDR